MPNLAKTLRDGLATEWRGLQSPCRASCLGIVLAAMAILSFAPAPARPDTIVQINLTALVFDGAAVCGPSGDAACTETFSGSFQYDDTTPAMVPGSGQGAAAGDLGAFTLPAGGKLCHPPGCAAFGAWDDSGGDRISTAFGLPTAVASVGGYPLDQSALDASSVLGLNDFPGSPRPLTFPVSGSITVTSVSPAPEPATLPLIALGIAGLSVARHKCRGWRQDAHGQ